MDISISRSDDVKSIIEKGVSGPTAVLIAKYRDQHPDLKNFTMPSRVGQVNVTVSVGTEAAAVSTAPAKVKAKAPAKVKAKAPARAKAKSPKKAAVKLNKTEQGILDGTVSSPSKLMAALDKGSVKYRQLNADQQKIVRSERSKRAAATAKANKA